MRSLRLAAVVAALSSVTFAAGCSGSDSGAATNENATTTTEALSMLNIATIAMANVGRGACSTNSGGGRDYDSSCSGNGGRPEYWCADFVRWVWAEAGAETSGLSAAAGSFYTYGVNHGTLHSTPAVGDAVVFNYEGGGYADHVAIVTQVNANGTIESVSGDWDGERGSEATFSSTSRVVVNAPAYESAVGDRPGVIGMKISGYISPAGASGAVGGSLGGASGSSGAGCYSPTLAKQVDDNACVENAEHVWYQCDGGMWTGRYSDPTACSSVIPY